MTHKTVKQITKAEAVEALIEGKVIKISVKLYKFKEVLMSTFIHCEEWIHFNGSFSCFLETNEPIFLMEETNESESQKPTTDADEFFGKQLKVYGDKND